MPKTSADFPVLSRLLAANAQWAKDVTSKDPQFFKNSSKSQTPKVLWIGCSDSRVPESVLMAAKPGDVFVCRNIANQFHLDDDSASSVLAYAIEHVGVEHVVVVGHSGCGGVSASFSAAKTLVQKHGHGGPPCATPLDRWLAPLTTLVTTLDVFSKTEAEALPVIVKENIKVQVQNVVKTDTISHAWSAGKPIHVHGWEYDLEHGTLRDLHLTQGPPSR